jgi:ankyrin repeat protein
MSLQATDALGNTPLHYAAGEANRRVLSAWFIIIIMWPHALTEGHLLLLHTCPSHPLTCHPAPAATGYGRPDLVSLLLAAGSDKAARNKNGKSAYDLAT